MPFIAKKSTSTNILEPSGTVSTRHAEPGEGAAVSSNDDPRPRRRRRTMMPTSALAEPELDSVSTRQTVGASKDDDYVGYKHPPKSSQFKKGQSGNPKGRPKAAKGTNTIVRELMTGKVEAKTSAGNLKMTRMEATIHKTLELGLKGNTRALLALIALYTQAVPDDTQSSSEAYAEKFTAADEAIIAAFKESLLGDMGDE